MRWHEDAGASQLFALLLGAALFSVGTAYLITASVDQSGRAKSSDENYETLSHTLAETIIQPGSGWYASVPCIGGLEQVIDGDGIGAALGRFGLGAEPCDLGAVDSSRRTLLAYSKIENLILANYSADANDYADYTDARNSLDLAGTAYNFHLRSWPVMADIRDILSNGHKDPNMRVLYIGDYSKGEAPSSPQYSTSVNDQSDRIVVTLSLTNTADHDTIFDALFEIELKTSKISFTLHTPVLSQDEAYDMSFTVLKTADWEWKSGANNKKIDVEVHDRDTKLFDAEISLETVTMTHASTQTNVFAEAEKLSTLLSGSTDAKYYYQAYDGKGKQVEFDDWTYELYAEGGGAAIRTDVLPEATEGSIVHTFDLTGSYVVKLWNDALTQTWNQDVVNLVNPEPGPFGSSDPTFVAEAPVLPEIRLIDALIEQFEPNAYAEAYDHVSAPHIAGGDVYPDIKDAMDNDLPQALTDGSGEVTLSKYTTIMVGSNVDHNSMTSQAAKAIIRDWVLAGGTLIVFGSANQNVGWLQPLFHASLDTANGGIAAPDGGHPALTVPNELSYDQPPYNSVSEWNYNAGAGSHFTHVVTAGETGDLLGIGNPGSFGKGTVILSGWQPYDLTDDQAETCPHPLPEDAACEAAFLIHNLVTLSYRELYLDYGPSPPRTSSTSTSTRVLSVYHPELDQHIAITLVVYVF